MQVIKEGLLKVDPGLLLWTIITFLVLLLLLWKAAWKPIVEALDARAEKIRGDIENADKSRQEAEKLLAEHRQMMGNAKDEASKVIAQGRDEAEKIRNDIIERANKDAKEIAERIKREISLAKDNALAEMKAEIVVLSTDIASKIIQKNLKPEDQNALVKETLNKIGTVQ
ncbi:MAG: ATP synthase F0 subunit B [Spirochaetae bacterium HGW-Spirochaetae-1]|jgi:F-type H+-transporting ATPase subunit b|nr:MAG: ATP synthase F0 subunit B [Spirochaetae bacterium HGW-Spirochaetae-1]